MNQRTGLNILRDLLRDIILKQIVSLKLKKKKSIFLTVCGSKCYGLIRNLLSPTKPDEKTFEELSKLVQDHLNPKPSEVIQR